MIDPLPHDAPDDVAFACFDQLIEATNEALRGSAAPTQTREELPTDVLPEYGPIMCLSRVGDRQSSLISRGNRSGCGGRIHALPAIPTSL
jgi:hypothetical protein